MKAMIMPGVNSGFGNGDVAALPREAIKGEWLVFPRPKTAIKRRCPMWPETAEAVATAIEQRSKPQDKADAPLVFITKYGRSWARRKGCPVSQEFTKLLRKVGIDRAGVGFYSLRHVFETIGGDTGDQVADGQTIHRQPRRKP